jgi:hypothetical protein
MPHKIIATLLALACLVLASMPMDIAQSGRNPEQGIPDPIPPPLPPEAPRDSARGFASVMEESELPWGLRDDLLQPLYEKAAVYGAFTRRFTCTETARLADYGPNGEASSEQRRHYGYLLIKEAEGENVREYRQRLARNGSVKRGEVKDDEPFPPAYAWVFMFSRFNEPYFAFRFTDDRFDGFDWVYEIQFKGSLPFTDGKDIRQWEGQVLLDAVTLTPLEIRAEPVGQKEKIETLYRRWLQSFSLIGFRLAPRPFGFRALIQFRHRSEGLTFPTELRYDRFRAVGIEEIIPVKASIRTYDDYRITRVKTAEELGNRTEP